MSQTQHDSSDHTVSTFILIASIVLIIGTLMPNLLDTYEGTKVVWFWQGINFNQPLLATIQLAEIFIVFIPLLIYLFLSKPKAAIAILFYMIALTVFLILRASQIPLLEGVEDIRTKATIGIITILIFLLMVVASRLAVSLPTRKFPLIIMGIISLMFLAAFIITKGSPAFNDLIDSSAWRLNPSRQLLNIFYLLLFIYTFLSSFKIFSGKLVVPALYILLTFFIIMTIYKLNTSPRDIPGTAIYMAIKIFTMAAAYVALFSASLYASGYMLGSRNK